jgi:hypothetical protein
MKLAVTLLLAVLFTAADARPILPATCVWYVGTVRGYKAPVRELVMDVQPLQKTATTTAPITAKPELPTTHPAWWMVAAGTLFAALTTTLIVKSFGYVARRRGSRKITTPIAAPVISVNPTVVKATIVAGPEEQPLYEDEDETEESADVARLAQQYGRGRGEVQFAMRIHSPGIHPATLPEKIRRAAAGKNQSGGAALAKKLGVGKGEIALAARLQKFNQSPLRVKEVA